MWDEPNLILQDLEERGLVIDETSKESRMSPEITLNVARLDARCLGGLEPQNIEALRPLYPDLDFMFNAYEDLVEKLECAPDQEDLDEIEDENEELTKKVTKLEEHIGKIAKAFDASSDVADAIMKAERIVLA